MASGSWAFVAALQPVDELGRFAHPVLPPVRSSKLEPIWASSGPVKRQRRYDASGRRERADRLRATIVEVAEHRFLRDGYTSTTVTGIASEAGVSPDTVYKAFGGKPGLVRAIRERALRGE